MPVGVASRRTSICTTPIPVSAMLVVVPLRELLLLAANRVVFVIAELLASAATIVSTMCSRPDGPRCGVTSVRRPP